MINRHYQGFTLIELLIAITISSGVILLVYQALDGAISTEERVTETTNNINGLQRVWRYMQDDFLHAIPRQWVDQSNNTQPAMQGLLSDRQSASSALEVAQDSQILSFIRSGEHNFFNKPQSDMQHVVYRLSKEEIDSSNTSVEDDFTDANSTTISLWRDYWRPIDSEASDAKALLLLDDIKDIQIRYLSSKSQRVDDTSWIGGWPESVAQSNQLPIAIEVTISTHTLGEAKRVFLLSDNDG